MKTIYINDYEMNPDDISLDPDIWKAANGFCFNEKGEVCIVYEEEKGYWVLPGGGKEKEESPEQTFVREVIEEAQAEPVDVRYFHAVYGQDIDDSGNKTLSHKICFRYICKLKNIEEFIPNKGGFEIDERKFVSLEELPSYITWLKDTDNGKESFEILKTKLY